MSNLAWTSSKQCYLCSDGCSALSFPHPHRDPNIIVLCRRSSPNKQYFVHPASNLRILTVLCTHMLLQSLCSRLQHNTAHSVGRVFLLAETNGSQHTVVVASKKCVLVLLTQCPRRTPKPENSQHLCLPYQSFKADWAFGQYTTGYCVILRNTPPSKDDSAPQLHALTCIQG